MAETQAELRQKAENDLVLSFLAVRRAIGYLGFFLPVVLILYGILSADGILNSISAYYYSPMREILVGTLCAQAVFLWSYEGYRPLTPQLLTDQNIARLAAIGALGIALLPTAEDLVYENPAGAPVTVEQPVDCTVAQCVLGEGVTALLHLASAGIFFGALAIFCLVLFVRGSRDTAEKRARQRIYRICGWVILAALAAMAAILVFDPEGRLSALRPIFWLETLACFAFATSWTVKGRRMRPLVRMAQEAT